MNHPRQSSRVHVEEVGGELCVYNLDGHQVHALNRTAAFVWQRCNGLTSPTEIATALEREVGTRDAGALVALTLQELGQANLFAEPLAPPAVQPGLTRRILLKRGVAAALIPVVASIAAPSAAAAQSALCFGLNVAFTGVLGSGSASWPSVSGTQTGRLNRNGLASTCSQPKTCNPIDNVPGRAFDAYTFANNCGATVCVGVTLDVQTQVGANYQSNAYLGSYDPVNLCTNYLADPGLSTGSDPPTPTNFSFNVPNGSSFVVVVHTVNTGESGGTYILTVSGAGTPRPAGTPHLSQIDVPSR